LYLATLKRTGENSPAGNADWGLRKLVRGSPEGELLASRIDEPQGDVRVGDSGTSLDLKTFEAAGLRVQPATNGLFAIGDNAHVFFQVVSPGVDDRLRISLLHENAVIR
jgi:hypothetical protein